MPSLSMLKQMAGQVTGLAGGPADGQAGRLPDANATQEEARLPLGVPAIDACLSGGLVRHGLHEVRCSQSRDIGTAAGFILSLLARAAREAGSAAGAANGRILWVIDPASAFDSGLPFPDGLRQHGIDAGRLVLVRPERLRDAIWSAGEAARCGDLAALIVQVRGNPPAFDATVSRRLLLRARENRVFTLILRQSGEEEAGAALTRWHAAVCPSLPDEGLANKARPWAVGHMRLVLTLEKNRNGQTGQWHVSWNPQTGAFEHAAQNPKAAHSGHPLSVSSDRPDRAAEMGPVLALERAS
ncbi:MAG: hypothetical protein M9908_09030 [Phyllobacteriaceae bacterium]|nr:hypothetical protein [Phyllobacteriaceae bacterium]